MSTEAIVVGLQSRNNIRRKTCVVTWWLTVVLQNVDEPLGRTHEPTSATSLPVSKLRFCGESSNGVCFSEDVGSRRFGKIVVHLRASRCGHFPWLANRSSPGSGGPTYALCASVGNLRMVRRAKVGGAVRI